MTDSGYLIWFIVTAVVTTGILATLIAEATGAFSHGRHHPQPRTPREAKQYWPHTGAH